MPTKMCPGCRALLDPSASTCEYCGWSMARTEVRRQGGAVDRATRRFGGVIPLLVFANVAFALATAAVHARYLPLHLRELGLPEAPGQGELILDGIMSPLPPVLDLMGGWRSTPFLAGEWWRLLCPMFLHGGLIHIAINMMALRNIGRAVEEAYGGAKALALYFLSGIAGCLASLSWFLFRERTGGVPEDIVSIGASGAIIGYAGLLTALGFRIGGQQGKELWAPMVKAVGFILVVGIALSFSGSRFRIDNTAHIGGYLFGLGAGFLCTFGARARTNLEAVRAWTAVAAILTASVAAAFVPAALRTLQALR